MIYSLHLLVNTVDELAQCIQKYAAKDYTIFVNKGWRTVLAGKVKPELLADSEQI
jgi:hypothetical protein